MSIALLFSFIIYTFAYKRRKKYMNKLKSYEKPSIIICAIVQTCLYSNSGNVEQMNIDNSQNANDDMVPYTKYNKMWDSDED